MANATAESLALKELSEGHHAFKKYQSSWEVSALQILETICGVILCWVLMYFCLQQHLHLLTIGLTLPAAGFRVRVFCIQHDCGHGSFFPSRTANDVLGSMCGVLTFTPYFFWRKAHAIHHQYNAELDHRGTGDIWTMTVREFQEAASRTRLLYRAFRHPLFLFGVAPLLNFVVIQRLPVGRYKRWSKREKASVHTTNLVLLLLYTGASMAWGVRTVFIIEFPTIMIAATVGTWLFYVQHQFETTYWEKLQKWNPTEAALFGSSFYDLPSILNWFTASIGYHHVHHLNARIPNYYLASCHQDVKVLRLATRITMAESWRMAWLALWDESKGRLVTFRDAELS